MADSVFVATATINEKQLSFGNGYAKAYVPLSKSMFKFLHIDSITLLHDVFIVSSYLTLLGLSILEIRIRIFPLLIVIRHTYILVLVTVLVKLYI